MEDDIPMDAAVISVYYTTAREMKSRVARRAWREIVADRT
jgi:hypothetical protein